MGATKKNQFAPIAQPRVRNLPAMTDPPSEQDRRSADIRLTLGRIIASPSFCKSPQLANFLRYVVDETLAGRGNTIKAYTIGVDALGRDASFDPQTDAIVRVEAARLRRALETYFDGEGRDDPIVIELPVGHYVPVFRCNKARRRAVNRFVALKHRYMAALRENYRLIVLIAVVALVVSLTLDLVGVLIVGKSWP